MAMRLQRQRLPFLALGGIALLSGLVAGLHRIGWWPEPAATFAALHGSLMVPGFFATLIGLERAVALRQPWSYLAPGCSGLGALALIIGLPASVSLSLMLIGALVLLLVSFALYRLDPEPHGLVMAAGVMALCLGVGGSLQANWPSHAIQDLWITFFVLVVAGERVELSRILAPPQVAVQTMLGLAVVLILSAIFESAGLEWAGRAFGAALGLIGVWLWRFDLARRNLRAEGLQRYMAWCLLPGYAWLIISGIVTLVANDALPRSIALHAVFLGFVMSMVFAHAPIILPAVLGVTLPFRNRFYVPLGLLHASLAVRVLTEMAGGGNLLAWSGFANVLALLAFLATTVWAIFEAKK